MSRQLQVQRLAHVSERAQRRLLRRDAACAWFVRYCRLKWQMWPKLLTRVTTEVYAAVPQLRSSPHHEMVVIRSSGKQHTRIIRYEECVLLAEEAQLLVTRLTTLRQTPVLATSEEAHLVDISGTQT